ncbi:hypothetical protein RB595_010498 [Gaeumannomyces hyphopodioides]
MDGLASWVQGQFLGAGHTAAGSAATARPSSQPAAGPSPDTSQPNAEGATPFRYAPLKSSSHFRILRLKSVYVDTSIQLNQHLHGSLVEASIESPPPYVALSYTWGDPALVESINIGGTRLGITASCAAALRRMLRGKFERMIWVDSICINQGSDAEALAERSGQVAMMDLIYRSARQVNVHLGSGDAASDAACDALRKLSWWCLAAIIPSPLQGFFKRKYDRLADEALEANTEYPYGKLHGVFRLPWFRRTWVAQEVILGRKVVFYCGEYLFNLTTLAAGADFTRLPHFRADRPTAHHWRSYLEWHEVMRNLVRKREAGEPVSNFELTLSGIISFPTLGLDATRPEDKIYGLYGICKSLGFDLPVPDYTKPLAVVYTEAATAILRYDAGNLEMLSWVCESPRASELGIPSWVPDFSGCISNWSPSRPPHVAMPLLTKEASRLRAASRGAQCRYEFAQDGRALKLRGRRLDTVGAVGVPWRVDNSANILGGAPTPTRQFVDSFISCIESWFDVAQGGESDPMRRLASLLGINAVRPLSAEQLQKLVRCVSALVAYSKSDHGDPPLGPPPTALAPDDPFADYWYAHMHFASIVNINQNISLIAWKTVMRTARGRDLGLVTHTVRVGDVVVIFHGCFHAAVLRPCGDGYKYVGPAYVERAIDGSWWRDSTTAADDDWFVLV